MDDLISSASSVLPSLTPHPMCNLLPKKRVKKNQNVAVGLLAPQIQRVCQFFGVKKTLICAIRHLCAAEKPARLSSALLVYIPQGKNRLPIMLNSSTPIQGLS